MKIDVEIKENVSITGKTVFGSYIKNKDNCAEKGWYEIIINITSNSIREDIQKCGLNNYLAAAEKELSMKKEKYGTIVLLSVEVDGSQRDNKEKRFISCKAKTNKKHIVGFSAIREGKHVILE
jgi:hypothetical protein